MSISLPCVPQAEEASLSRHSVSRSCFATVQYEEVWVKAGSWPPLDLRNCIPYELKEVDW